MQNNLTAVKKVITLHGYKAEMRISKDGKKRVFVTWKDLQDCIIEDWEPFSEQLDLLLAKVRDWVSDNPELTLWSY